MIGDARAGRPTGGFARFLAVAAAAWAVAGIFLFAGGGLDAQPPFVDEAANLAQRRFWRIWTERNHPDWLAYAAYDHAPLDKLWLGFWATCVPGGNPAAVPRNLDEWKTWMAGTHPPRDGADLAHARRGMLVLSVASCLGVGWLAWELAGPLAGLAALALFVGSPLVFRHARMAMPEVALAGATAAALAAAAGALRRRGGRSGALVACAGTCAAAAVLAKLSGLAAFAALGLVAAAALAAGRWRVALKLAAAVAFAAVLVGLADPFYGSHPPRAGADPRLADLSPWQRLRFALEHRERTLAGQARLFPKDFVPPAERPAALLFSGIGRWSFLARPYAVAEADLPRMERIRGGDVARGVLVAGAAAAGLWLALRHGGQERKTCPRAWLLVAWIVVDVALTMRGLALDWDRYYISAIGWSSVAAGCAAGWLAPGRRRQ